ncbi:MAG TPA: tetratricopeptide repeat protein [Coleofasciculaceae cyanobacterium]|jgi:tetratricopeptide (TPR) repeat protein
MANFTPQVKRVGKSDKEQLKLAFGLAKEERFDEALAEFETILQNNPNSKLAHLGTGNMFFKKERYDEALRHFQIAARLDSLLPQAQVGAGQVLLRQGELEQALEKFQTAINIDPNYTEAYQGVGQVLARQEKYDEAIQQWRRAQRLNPQLISVRLLMAQAYQEQGKLAEALSELKSALNIDPTRWRTHQALGRLYLQQQEYIAAVEAFQTAHKFNPDIQPFARLGLVEALVAVKRLEEAAEILRKMPRIKPIEPMKHQLWGDIYQSQGLLKEATEEYRAAALLAAEEGDTLDELANLDGRLEQDEDRGQEIVALYKAAADKRVSVAQQRQRQSFKESRLGNI